MSDSVRKDLEDCWYGRGIYQPGNANKSMDKFLSRYVVIPREDLPEVKDCGSYANVGTYCMAGNDYKSADLGRLDMLSVIAWHEYLLARDAKEAEKTAARDKRRDELSRELTLDGEGFSHAYMSGPPSIRRAIDRIIELEDAAA